MLQMDNDPRRVLVTGAAGFIGFHLAKTLANNAAKNPVIVGMDNFNDYYDVRLKIVRETFSFFFVFCG